MASQNVYDLSLFESRCRLKAEGALWAVERQKKVAAGFDHALHIRPRDQQVIEAAKAIEDCYLWMNCSPVTDPAQWSLYELIAGCFTALANALALVQDVIAEDKVNDHFKRALHLTVTAQSALRQAVDRLGAEPDMDQLEVYSWIRSECQRENIYIARHMRDDDPAAPESWGQINRGVAELKAEVQRCRNATVEHDRRIEQLCSQVEAIRREEDVEGNWNVLAETVAEMVNDGVPPSNIEIREALLPVFDQLPTSLEFPAAFNYVIREIDTYRAGQSVELNTTKPEPLSAEVQAARRLLRGRSIVLIGGDERDHSADALKEAFDLRELVWVSTNHHVSYTSFEPHVARSDVAVVLLAIRWASHSFVNVQQYCDKYGKPLVRLPRGYNPNQVAAQILQQCGDRLRQQSR